MRGAPLKALQEYLGHADIKMTLRYAHLSPDAKRDYVNLLDELEHEESTKPAKPKSLTGYDAGASGPTVCN